MKTKRNWLLLLALVAIFALVLTLAVACDDNDSEDGEPSEYFEDETFSFRLNEDGESYSLSSVVNMQVTSVTVPATVNGKPVTFIGMYAFRGSNVKEVVVSEGISSLEDCAFSGSNVTTVTLPNSLKTIGSSAFSECYGLTAVTIPDGVETIGSHAFAFCTNLTSVTVGSGVKTVEYGAFHTCSSLKSIVLGDSVEYIGYNVFQECAKLESLELPFLAESLKPDAEIYNLWRLFAGEVGVPSTLKTVKINAGVIGSNAFVHCPSTLTNIILGEHVTELSSDAFGLFSGLIEIDVPDSVTKIGTGAFSYCSNLETVKLGNGIDKIEAGLFQGCGALTNVTIPNSIQSIGSYAFDSCQKLTALEIPSNVTSIGDYAFRDCCALKEINLPDALTEVCLGVFQSCSSLTAIEIPERVKSIGNYAFTGCASLAKIEIPSAVKSIGAKAFSDCSGLKEISIGSGVETIGEGALRCKPSKVSYAGSIESWLAIHHESELEMDSGYDFYIGGELLVDLVIPDTVTSIREFAFFSCGSIETVTIGSNVRSMGYNSFGKCRNLQKVYWNATACNSAEGAFDDYCNIYYVEIGENVMWIPDRTFVNSGKIAEVFNKSQLEISSSSDENGYVAHHAYNVFTPTEGSSQLLTTSDGFVFCKTNSDARCVLVAYVGDKSELVLPKSPWSGYKYNIGDYAFYGNDSVTKITLSSDTYEIGQRSFAICANLTELVIPVGLSSISYCGVDSENLTIRFLGTMEQWRSVYKSPAYISPKVICSDGTCEFR